VFFQIDWQADLIDSETEVLIFFFSDRSAGTIRIFE
jgi:hypothetical protein